MNTWNGQVSFSSNVCFSYTLCLLSCVYFFCSLFFKSNCYLLAEGKVVAGSAYKHYYTTVAKLTYLLFLLLYYALF